MGNVQPNTAYATSYSGPLSWGLVMFTSLISLPICAKVFTRRNMYPLNGTPCYVPLLSLIGCPLGVYGFLALYLGELPNCWARKIGAVTGYFPAPTAVFVQMIYVYFVYQIQLERNLPLRQRKYSVKLISFPYLLLYHLLLVIAFTLPSTIIPFLFREVDPITGDCIIKSDAGSKMGNMILDLLTKVSCALFGLRLAYLLKGTEEVFNLKASARRAAFACLYFSVPVAVVDIVGGMFLPRSITIHIAFVNRVSWCFVFVNHLFWAGVVPLFISYKEEAHRRRIQAFRSQRTSSRRINYARNIAELQKALYQAETTIIRDEFALYLVKEFCLENLLFVDKVRGLKKGLGIPMDGREIVAQSSSSLIMPLTEKDARANETDIHRQARVRNKEKDIRENPEVLEEVSGLLRQFLLPGSDTAINISDSLRQTLKREMESAVESGDASPVLKPLDEAEKEVLMIMMDPFNRFIKLFEAEGHSKTGSVTASSTSAASKSGAQAAKINSEDTTKKDNPVSLFASSSGHRNSRKVFSLQTTTAGTLIEDISSKRESASVPLASTTVTVRSTAATENSNYQMGGESSVSLQKVAPMNNGFLAQSHGNSDK